MIQIFRFQIFLVIPCNVVGFGECSSYKICSPLPVWPRWKKVAHLFLLAKFAKEYGVKDIAAIVQLQLLSRVLDTCLSEELFDPVALDSELFTWSFFRIHKFWYFQKRLKSEEKSWKGVGKVCNLSKQWAFDMALKGSTQRGSLCILELSAAIDQCVSSPWPETFQDWRSIGK